MNSRRLPGDLGRSIFNELLRAHRAGDRDGITRALLAYGGLAALAPSEHTRLAAAVKPISDAHWRQEAKSLPKGWLRSYRASIRERSSQVGGCEGDASRIADPNPFFQSCSTVRNTQPKPLTNAIAATIQNTAKGTTDLELPVT